MSNKNIQKIDRLTEDQPIPGQLWACISFLSPEGIRNCKVRGLKIRGVYGTKEEADKRAAFLQNEDGDFHVFVGEVGKWLPWDPDPSSAEDQVYKEEELQKLMESYQKNRERVKELEKERKDELTKTAKADNRKQEVVNRLRKKLDDRKNKLESDDSKDNNKDINKDINTQKIKDMEEQIKEQESLVKELDENREVIINDCVNDSVNDDSNSKQINLEENLDIINRLYKEINVK
jgi:hypothetical protein